MTKQTTSQEFTLEEIEELSATLPGIVTILLHWQRTRPYTVQVLDLEGCVMDLGMHIYQMAQIPEAIFEAEVVADQAFGEEA